MKEESRDGADSATQIISAESSRPGPQKRVRDIVSRESAPGHFHRPADDSIEPS